MNHTYVTPFITSATKVFETMLALSVTVGTPQRKSAATPAYGVSGIIGMSGDVDGAVVLSFPTETAERVVALFTGTPLSRDHEDFADAIGELINMISGGAKAQFPCKRVTISCPSVVVGSNHVVFGRKDVISITIPCHCDCGDFAVEVSFRMNSQAATVTTEAAPVGA
jgi:chemotaxis protein CheX